MITPIGAKGTESMTISNLLSSALRYTERASHIAIAIAASTPGHVRVVVANSDETIAASELPRLFDRFYRADPSRSGEGTHFALGLAIVKSIVDAHGGGGDDGESFAGTTSFILRLPCAEAA